MRTLNDITIRDPFVLVFEGRYYMYGTRSHLTWKKPEILNTQGFDVYVSDDLVHWSEPVEIFKRPNDFWATMNFWAPEVHLYEGKFYLFATFWDQLRCRGTQILVADNPLGPFELHSDGPVTPVDWECLDGTLYIAQDKTPYMVFCHEWVQITDGTICAIELTPDLSAAIGEPFVMLHGSTPKWADGDNDKNRFVTDGPCLHRTSTGQLIMFWSTLVNGKYVEAISYSDTGEISGNWITHDELLFTSDGGHGMVFKTLDEKLFFTLHSPNINYHEHPVFFELTECGNTVKIKE